MALNVYNKGTVTYKDIDLSFKAHPLTGDIGTKSDLDAIKQSVKNILFTLFGERRSDYFFGSRLNRLLFQPIDAITKIELQDEINRALATYEPRISVIQIKTFGESDANELGVSVYFNMQNFLEPQSITVILNRRR